MVELHVFEYGGTAFGTFEKTCLKVEDFYVKTIGWEFLKIMFLTMKNGKVGYSYVAD